MPDSTPDSTLESRREYGTWVDTSSKLQVSYSLLLFNEIDFVVNEGYRRIPHGGIEQGGLLFGYSDRNAVRIEVFRPIQCEHALGPSFKLSESDVAVLRTQILEAGSDPELKDLQLLGWFIGHTRSSLEVNETELKLFDELLPGTGKLTILIKPEKFKPTLFAFLVRQADGRLSSEGAKDPVILPLSGRGPGRGAAESSASEVAAEQPPTPSLETPGKVGAREPAARASEEYSSIEDEAAAIRRARRLARQMSPEEAARPLSPAPAEEAPVVPPAPVRSPLGRTDRGEPRFEKQPPVNVAAPVERPPLSAAPWPDEIYSAGAISQGAPWSARDRQNRPRQAAPERSKLQFAAVMLLSAALGCCLGYWAYLQLPSSVIALDVRPEAAGLVLSWPPEQTRDSPYAAIRINDGEPVPLSAIAKMAGQSHIEASGDNVKVELIAQHWIRNSRGIVRYVAAASPVPAPAFLKTGPPRDGLTRSVDAR